MPAESCPPCPWDVAPFTWSSARGNILTSVGTTLSYMLTEREVEGVRERGQGLCEGLLLPLLQWLQKGRLWSNVSPAA